MMAVRAFIMVAVAASAVEAMTMVPGLRWMQNMLGGKTAQSQQNRFTVAAAGAALYPQEFGAVALNQCRKNVIKHNARAQKQLDAALGVWKERRPDGGIVVEDADAQTCSMRLGPTNGATEVFSIAAAPEDDICAMKGGWKPPIAEQKFGSRRYLAIWPKEGTCTKTSKCPVVMFFHGCGGMLPLELQARYDQSCRDNLGSVLLFPKIESQSGETWTGDGTEMLETFVIPFWEEFLADHGDIIDEDHVTAAGESLGAGMALQTAISRPDIFRSVIAMGVTDGSSCKAVEHFKTDKLKIKAGSFSEHSRPKLDLVVATLAEKEANLDERVSGILDALDSAGAGGKVAVHFRFLSGANHVTAIHQAQNQWTAFHQWIWEGKKM